MEGSRETSVASTPAQVGQDRDADEIYSGSHGQEDNDRQDDSAGEPPFKKPRMAVLRREESLGLSQLSIESASSSEDSSEIKDNQDSEPASPSTSTRSLPQETRENPTADDPGALVAPTLGLKKSKKAMAIVEFDKNTELTISIYFKQGMGR